MAPHLFFLLHDVSENTYSQTLIPSNNMQNLHKLFSVRPRWYNRSKATCDRNNVMMIRFKHATPYTQMVSLSDASQLVRRAVTCIKAEAVSRASDSSGASDNTKFATIAKITTGVTTALVGMSAAVVGTHLYANKKAQQKLNDKCLKTLKDKIGNVVTNNNPTIHEACNDEMKAENGQNIQKNITIGAGNYGTVWSVVNDDTIVIKEQTALCYTFINEIECLDILKNTGIIPQLKNAYVCFNKKNNANVKNSDITYWYVMEKLDYTLVKFIDEMDKDTFTTNKNDIAKKLMKILTILTTNDIKHRDLHLENFMVKLKQDSSLETIYIIDFGHATYKGKSKPMYTAPEFLPDIQTSNLVMFIMQNNVKDVIKNRGTGISRTSELITAFSNLLDTYANDAQKK